MAEPPPERATILDVARHAGVAVSSASAALNGRPGVSTTTRNRVQQVAAELGYVPSLRGRSLSSKRAFSVGLVIERDFAVMEADPFFGAFLGGAEEALTQRGYALSLQIVGDSDTSLSRHRELALNRRVDGLFLSEIRIDDPRIEVLAASGLPTVGINPDRDCFPFPAVHQDGTAAIGALVQVLANLGHRRMAHVSGPPAYVHSRDRMTAWTAAVQSVGLTAEHIVEGDFTLEGGRQAAEQVLRHRLLPTAVFCANDLTAIGFINRILEQGLRVPEDISVAGFDGITLGEYLRPTLTTIRTDPRGLGREAARMLLSAIDGQPPDNEWIPAAELALRDSVGPEIHRPPSLTQPDPA